MTHLVTQDELIELTGSKLPRKQIEILTQHGEPFRSATPDSRKGGLVGAARRRRADRAPSISWSAPTDRGWVLVRAHVAAAT